MKTDKKTSDSFIADILYMPLLHGLVAVVYLPLRLCLNILYLVLNKQLKNRLISSGRYISAEDFDMKCALLKGTIIIEHRLDYIPRIWWANCSILEEYGGVIPKIAPETFITGNPDPFYSYCHGVYLNPEHGVAMLVDYKSDLPETYKCARKYFIERYGTECVETFSPNRCLKNIDCNSLDKDEDEGS